MHRPHHVFNLLPLMNKPQYARDISESACFIQKVLAQCVVYLARAPKSIEVYSAYDKAKQCVRSQTGPLPGVPLHLRNAPTKLMKNIGMVLLNCKIQLFVLNTDLY